MPAQTLPISINPANAAPVKARGPATDSAAEAAAPFSEALSREIGQRQQAGNPAAATGQDARNTTDVSPGEPDQDVSTETGAEEATIAAEAITPLTDMLVLAASLAPPATTVPADAPSESTDASKMGTDPISATGTAAASAAPVASLITPAASTGNAAVAAPNTLAPATPPTAAVLQARLDTTPVQLDESGVRAKAGDPASPAAAIFAQALAHAVQPAGAGSQADAAAQLRTMFATSMTLPSQAGGGASAEAALQVSDRPLDAAQPMQARPALTETTGQAAKAQVADAQTEQGSLTAPGGDNPAEAAQAPVQDASFATQLQAARTAEVQPSAMLAGDRIPARIGTPAWDKQLGQKIVFMAAGAEQSASLTLNPPDLGPVQVVLNITNDQASVAFSSSQLEVRQALENAMPKLREMMGESGITLGNATVNAGVPEQQQQAQRGQDARAGGHTGNGNGRDNNGRAGGDDAAPALPVRRVATGAVDTFA